MMIRQLLGTNRSLSVDGKAAIDLLTDAILSDDALTLTLLSDKQLVKMCPASLSLLCITLNPMTQTFPDMLLGLDNLAPSPNRLLIHASPS